MRINVAKSLAVPHAIRWNNFTADLAHNGRRHELAIEMPGGMPENRHDHGKPRKDRDGTDDKKHGHDEAPSATPAPD